jgi:hypothetical protein
MTKLELPERGGGVGNVAVARQTRASAIGGCHGRSERGRSREACMRGQEESEVAGGRAGRQSAAKRKEGERSS